MGLTSKVRGDALQRDIPLDYEVCAQHGRELMG
ncbi:hypothetical protein Cenrod_1959 [Candidatus Symbiobacter mobilis CR]|uniref:Uncharacterized protein n=1 Tax=Candidatus Symbiobacter mobilis CR TaxID=946483 RepID=U5N9P3_9BURK|nr:hypothetical protein Cenrod_1959 [Candidatus Symbiobacter mobilis CR]